MKKIMTVFGTRPEAIKMAPLVKEIECNRDFESIVVVTGQHREMLDQVLDFFEINPNFDLNIMEKGQGLEEITQRVIEGLSNIFQVSKPDIILVHGDTTTTFASALTAFYHKIPIGHIEAGLRTWDKYSPFPEEINRQLTDILADLYFAPTEQSKKNLLMENHDSGKIYVTGNTAIDAMKFTIRPDYQLNFLFDLDKYKVILITVHRRENLGKPMEDIFNAINQLIQEHNDIIVVFPIHKNPKIRKIADTTLIKSQRIKIIEPLDVIDFHNLASKSYLILTDSGGIQEEAPHLGVPVLVLRDTTERPEGIIAGTLKLVGTNTTNIVNEVKHLLIDGDAYSKMSNAINPYGDGQSSKRIVKMIENYLGDEIASGSK